MTAIEWTDVTWNPVTGCSRVSPGCDNCYMFEMYPRLRAMDANVTEPDESTGFFKTVRHYNPSQKTLESLFDNWPKEKTE